MRNRVERLRLWLLAGAGLLVLVLATFIGSARYVRRNVLARLPQKLGVNIKSETKDVTLNHTSLNGTVYKIRVSTQDELTDGTFVLHDASILLYGTKQNRSDRIYGDEFQYDPNAGLLRAIGLVHIDMQAAEPAGSGGKRAGGPPDKPALAPADGGTEKNILHATTSGLVYMEKLGVAATGERIDFQLAGMTGHATGADYSSDSDVLMLHSAVYVSGVPGGHPVVLTASSAEIDNRDRVTYLTHAKYVSLGETVEADQATLHTRADGTLERIEAQGNVTSRARGATVVCAREDVLLDARSEPQSALLTGGVAYSSDEPLRQRRGNADSAAISFDAQAKPQPDHALFTGSVHMIERTRAAGAGSDPAKEPWSVRDLTAAKVEVALAPMAQGKTEPRDAEATGDPRLAMVDAGSLESGRGESRTELAADDLKAHFVATAVAGKPVWPETLAGRGHTLLHQVSADGIEQTSAGDTLDAKFRPPAATAMVPAKAAGVAAGTHKERPIADQLLSAVQQGHVTIMRRVPAASRTRPGVTRATTANAADDVEHAVAARAVYDGDTDRVLLTGSVQLTDAGSVLWADRVALDHKTGDAQAEGAVKVNYVQDSSTARPAQAGSAPAIPPAIPHGGSTQKKGEADPAHILADRADLNHATDVGTFYGRPARLWQGGSQVQAPVLEFARAQKRLIARGETAGGGQAVGKTAPAEVHTVLVSAGAEAPGSEKAGTDKAAGSRAGTCKAGAADSPAGTAGSVARPPPVVRIASHELIYSDLLRKAEFTGGVRVENADGTMLARDATAYLESAKASGASSNKASGGVPELNAAGLSLDGRIDRVVASGKIEIEQPGFHASGGELLYTGSDGLYVLRGEDGAPAKVVDAQGTTTGTAFQFHSGDCNVEALGAVPGEKGTGQGVRTETTVGDEKRTRSAKH